MTYDVDGAIRRIPHHPKPGILFYDLMPLFEDPAGLDACVQDIADWARPREIDVVLGAEARGFILGGAIALTAPNRVLTLTSIMSSAGRNAPPASAAASLLQRFERERFVLGRHPELRRGRFAARQHGRRHRYRQRNRHA